MFPRPEKIQEKQNKIQFCFAKQSFAKFKRRKTRSTPAENSLLIATKLIAVGETLLYFFPSQQRFEEKNNKIDTGVDDFCCSSNL